MAIEQGKGEGWSERVCVRCGFASRPKRVAWLLYIIRTCEQARLATTTAAFRPLPRKLCVFLVFGFGE